MGVHTVFEITFDMVWSFVFCLIFGGGTLCAIFFTVHFGN